MEYHGGKPWTIHTNVEPIDTDEPDPPPSNWKKRSIYRIPAVITDENKKAYQPQLVSLGPYHHGSINLEPMEKRKRRAMRHFMKRLRMPRESFFNALRPFVEELKAAYDQLDEKWQTNDEAFLDLMITDGCFVLEILRIDWESYGNKNIDDDGDDRNYPIFGEHGNHYTVPHLRMDMLMLENQLPFLVLEILDSLEKNQGVRIALIRLIADFFGQEIPNKKLRMFHDNLHLLGIYRKSLLIHDPPRLTMTKYFRRRKNYDEDQIIRTATDLKEEGIIIKKSKTKSLKDISFKNGILRLPSIVVDEGLESLYLNLVALERSHVHFMGREVTHYVHFMDSIIDSSADVKLLCSRGVMRNLLGSDKAAATLFNSLSKNTMLDKGSPLDEVRKQVDAYCREPWHKWRAYLMHNYFTNPWVGLSVVAAFFLFALTTVQTVYTVLGYYKEK